MIKTKVETNSDYHSSRAISASGLKKIHKKSVYHFVNSKPYTSQAMDLGTAIHTLTLEPELFDDQVKFYNKIDGRTAEGKAQKAELLNWQQEGKLAFPEEDRAMFTVISENFNGNKDALHYAQGDVELSHYIEDFHGVYLRIRPDVINREEKFISDVKTCRDNSPRAFRNDIWKYSYHIQAAVYCDALDIPVENFVFIAIETVHPYSVQCYSLSEEMIERGRVDYMNAIDKWKHYLDTGEASLYDSEYKNDKGIILL